MSACSLIARRSLSYAKTMPARAMRACSLIAERNLSYAKIAKNSVYSVKRTIYFSEPPASPRRAGLLAGLNGLSGTKKHGCAAERPLPARRTVRSRARNAPFGRAERPVQQRKTHRLARPDGPFSSARAGHGLRTAVNKTAKRGGKRLFQRALKAHLKENDYICTRKTTTEKQYRHHPDAKERTSRQH